MQFLLGAAAAVVVFLLLLRIPFPHRAKTPERLEYLIGELYHRGERGSYADVVYRLGKGKGGRMRVSKVLEAENSVHLVISVPFSTTSVTLAHWSGAGERHLSPEAATASLLGLLTDSLGADLRRVFLVYHGLSPASDSIGLSTDARRHR